MADMSIWLCLLVTLASVIFVIAVINGLAKHNATLLAGETGDDVDWLWYERASRVVIGCCAWQVVLVLSLQHYRVDRLREMLAMQIHMPVESIQINEEQPIYELQTPNGTRVTWSPPNGMRSGASGTELSGVGRGVFGHTN